MIHERLNGPFEGQNDRETWNYQQFSKKMLNPTSGLVKSMFRSKQYQKIMPFLILHKIFMMFWGKISLNCC